MIKDIPNTFGYKVSDDGRVYSTKRRYNAFGKEVIKEQFKELKQGNGTAGYNTVDMVFIDEDMNRCKICKTVHRLVAEAFVPNPNNKPHVNHIDGNKRNNKASNLEWVTRAENANHAYSNGLIQPSKGEDHYASKLSEKQCISLIQDILDGLTNNQLSKKYKLHSRYISLIRHKKRWKHVWDKYFKNIEPPISNGKKLSSKLNKEIKEEIIQKIKQGAYLTKLSKEYGISRSFLTKVRKHNNWDF